MLINTERLKLTHFKTDYAEAFAKAFNDSKIFLHLPESVPDLNDIENLIQWFIERDRKNVINGFETLNLDEIVAGVKPNNVASISVLEKIDLVYQNTIEKVPKGCEFYLGEFYYSIKKNQYLINKV